jgi:hypothetical protein
MWRELGKWIGPYKLVNVNKESCIITLPRGNTSFYSMVVKLYLIVRDDKDTFNPKSPLKLA